NAINMFKDMKCNVEEANLDFLSSLDSMGTSGKIASVEGGRDLGPLFVGKEDLLGVSMQSRLSLPKPSHEEYLQALLNRQKIRQGFMDFFKDVDILICPTSPVSAPKHNQLKKDLLLDVDGILTPGRTALMSTMVYDLTGSPAISVPFGIDKNGMPIGVQIVGRHFEEQTVLNAAYKLELLSDLRENVYGDHKPTQKNK
ncbi:MAG: amidase family protein, partial [Dehalococcoidia bacterium]